MIFSLILSACGDNINSSDAPAEYTMESTEIDTDNNGNGLYTPEINATTINYIRELFHTKEEAVFR